MKVNKIVYWTSTILFAAFFLMSASMYFTKAPAITEGLAAAGFPPFMINILGVAKLLGVIALLQPKSNALKEWGYAGFTIVLIGATWTHIATNTPFVMPVVFMIVLAVSYVSWKRMLAGKEARVVYA
jgi:hypothetical protein